MGCTITGQHSIAECVNYPPCRHPFITVLLLQECERLSILRGDSRYLHHTCPDCGWRGYPYLTQDDEIVYSEEPKGVPA